MARPLTWRAALSWGIGAPMTWDAARVFAFVMGADDPPSTPLPAAAWPDVNSLFYPRCYPALRSCRYRPRDDCLLTGFKEDLQQQVTRDGATIGGGGAQ